MDALNRAHVRWAMPLSVAVTALALWHPPRLEAQLVLTLLSGLLLGAPHGLTDILHLPRLGGMLPGALAKRWPSLTGMALYVMGAGLFLWTWSLWPVANLCLFLLVSAWHFGGQDVKAYGGALRYPRMTGLSRGLGLVGMLILPHPETSTYFNQMTNTQAFHSPEHAPWLAGALALLWLGSALATRHRLFMLETALLAMFIYVLPPLIGFTLYFCTWHAPRHLMEYGEYIIIHAYVTFLSYLTFFTIILYLVFSIFWTASLSLPLSQVEALDTLWFFFRVLAALTMVHVMVAIMEEKRT
jgi:Brp/Blh family beta-carotene 15,15'-monooxygenase